MKIIKLSETLTVNDLWIDDFQYFHSGFALIKIAGEWLYLTDEQANILKKEISYNLHSEMDLVNRQIERNITIRGF